MEHILLENIFLYLRNTPRTTKPRSHASRGGSGAFGYKVAAKRFLVNTGKDDPTILTAGSREKVNEAIARLQRERKRPTRDRVIASLSFGFWQALFNGTYEELWRMRLWRAFPHGTGKRREVANLTGPILHFRNRVAHHEPIFFSNLERHHSRILELARLIDEEAERYIASLSRVDRLLGEKP